MADELTCPLCGRTCRDDGDWRGHLLGQHRKSEIVADLEDRVRAGAVAERDRPVEEPEPEPGEESEELAA